MSNGKFSIQVLYPASAAPTFNMDYYINVHVKKATNAFKDAGILSCIVSQLDPSSGYCVSTMMIFESKEAVEKNMSGPVAEELRNDVPNFSSVEPISLAGGVVSML